MESNVVRTLVHPRHLTQLWRPAMAPQPPVEGRVGAVGTSSNPTVAGSIPAGRAPTKHHALIHALLIMLVTRVAPMGPATGLSARHGALPRHPVDRARHHRSGITIQPDTRRLDEHRRLP